MHGIFSSRLACMYIVQHLATLLGLLFRSCYVVLFEIPQRDAARSIVSQLSEPDVKLALPALINFLTSLVAQFCALFDFLAESQIRSQKLPTLVRSTAVLLNRFIRARFLCTEFFEVHLFQFYNNPTIGSTSLSRTRSVTETYYSMHGWVTICVWLSLFFRSFERSATFNKKNEKTQKRINPGPRQDIAESVGGSRVPYLLY